MRTNIEINDKLMRDAIRATGVKTERRIAEMGLEMLVRVMKKGKIRGSRGRLEWQGDLKRLD